MMEEIQSENEQVKIESRNEKEENNGAVIDVDGSGDEHHSDIRPFVRFREKTLFVLHSHKFQLAVIGLVILDCLLVITEMLLDLHSSDNDKSHAEHEEQLLAAHIIHYFSIAILSIFVIELGFKLYAYQLEFFQHKLEVFDAVVVLLSFALDVAFINTDSAAIGTGLLILLRLWRVARILNGVVLSVKTQAEHKLAKERQLRDGLEQERFQNQEYIASLEQEVERLQKLLQEHGIRPLNKSPSPPKLN